MKTDALIKHEVLCELKWDTRVDELGIQVDIDDRVACLTGTVKHYGQKIAAQEAAHRVEGVLDVVNDIDVHLPVHLARTDQDIAHMVRKIIDWNRRTPAVHITSTVSNGWVTLEGHVEMQHEHDTVEQAIRHLACVRGVNNLIRVGRQEGLLEGRYIFDEAAIERGVAR